MTNHQRPLPDPLLVEIADYVTGRPAFGDLAYQTARLCLMDSLGCGLLALNFPQCTKLLGPIVPGATLPAGARVPGTRFELDPVQAAFNIGAAIRWLDFNDTWLAAEWGHPSDNLAGILAVADWLRRSRQAPITVRDVLTAMIRAYEIQGVLALENAFNRAGLDHVLLVRVATTAVATALLEGTHAQVIDALSNAFIDGGALRTYRQAPNTGSRKSWAAGDAASRAVRLALLTLAGEMGYPTALSAEKWGFGDVLFSGQPIVLGRQLASYVIENVLFKIAYPAEFHAQTAVEAAVQLHPLVRGRTDEIEAIRIETQESALRIIDKSGPLFNPADRDHCLQYMTAVALLKGDLTADDYEDAAAADPRIDLLRAKMQIVENCRYSFNYLNQEKRSIGNSVQVFFTSGEATPQVEVEYPLGHRRRREESLPALRRKFATSIAGRLGDERSRAIVDLFNDPARLDALPIDRFVDLFVPTN